MGEYNVTLYTLCVNWLLDCRKSLSYLKLLDWSMRLNSSISQRTSRKVLNIPNTTPMDVSHPSPSPSRLQTIHPFSLLTHSGIPTIVDHDNNDFALWESNAINKYLVERYDKEKKFYFPQGTNESSLVDQWLSFQASGQVRCPHSSHVDNMNWTEPTIVIQGPYFGQAVHFERYHPVKVPTAVERYRKEVRPPSFPTHSFSLITSQNRLFESYQFSTPI